MTDIRRRGNLPSLTGLRWLAALAVFGVHAGITTGPFVDVLALGPAGVSFFFVLSGFVLTWSARPGGSAAAFYVRRAARIYPLYAVTWLLILPLVGLGVYQYGARPFFLGLGLLQAWSPRIADFYGGNGVGWSLSCEAFFYLLFPAAFAVLHRRTDRVLLAVAAAAFATMVVVDGAAALFGSTSAIGAQTSHWLWLAYIFPPTRFMEFLIGCIAALLVSRGRVVAVPWAAAWVLVIGSYLATQSTVDVRVWSAITVLPYALLICAYARTDARGQRTWFGRRWSVTLGAWSYAFYLVHQPIIRFVRYYLFPTDYLPFDYNDRTVVATSLALSVLCAALLHYAVERPAERAIRSALPVGRAGKG